MSPRPFEFVPLPPERSLTKPRGSGLTMIVDWGVGLAAQRDLLELAGEYVDLAKVAVGTSRLYDGDRLKAKLNLYREHDVRPFLGGQFQEYVFATLGAETLPRFYDEAKRVGFEVIEISDNCVPLNDEQRAGQITLAREHGLTVFGEVGSKTETHACDQLISQAQVCLDAGAELLLVEGAELVEDGQIREGLLAALRNKLDLKRVLFEVPGPWISGITLAGIHDLKKMLVREFGPDVNLANIMPDEVMETEALRVGLGVVGPKLADQAN